MTGSWRFRTLVLVKARAAALLSLTGVLVTGGAAAFVNAQVLDSTARPHSGDVAITESAVAPTAATTPPPVTTAAYLAGDAGRVVLDTADGGVRIVEVQPAAGWSVASSSTGADGVVRVTFTNGVDTVVFEADVDGPVLRTVVDGVASLSPIPGGGTTTPTSPDGSPVSGPVPGGTSGGSSPATTTRPNTSAPVTTVDDDEGDDTDDPDEPDEPEDPDEPDEPDDD